MTTRKDIGKTLPPHVNANKMKKIYLYALRVHDFKIDLKLQLVFDRTISFTFNDNKQSFGDHDYGPVIYTCDLDSIEDEQQQHLYVDHAGQLKYIEDFHVKCSHTGLLNRTIVHDTKNNPRNLLIDYPNEQHIFLFNTRFHSSYGVHAPGNYTILFDLNSDFYLFR